MPLSVKPIMGEIDQHFWYDGFVDYALGMVPCLAASSEYILAHYATILDC